MGQDSSCPSSLIVNMQGRMFYESVLSIKTTNPEILKQKKKLGKIIKSIWETLKRIPESATEIPLIITGEKVGPSFLEIILPHLTIPQYLTKISFRKCGLKSHHAKSIANLLINYDTIKELDVSQNDFKDSSNIIISAAVGHPSLTSLLMESCNINDSSSKSIIDLLQYSRILSTFRAAPNKLSNDSINDIKKIITSNIYLKNIDLGQHLQTLCSDIVTRNTTVFEYSDTIARAPFQRQFRAKLDVFKSIKGRQMLDGKARQKERVKGTALFNTFVENESKAKTIESNETVQNTEHSRYGSAETVGRRPQMEDVSCVVPGIPTDTSVFFGLFDGHGGRDASEYVSQNLPNYIKSRVSNGSTLTSAITESFKVLQNEMKPWCVYFGTTAAIAVIDGLNLTVANVGDSRCVLSHNGQAVRLTIDDKPDLPEEMEYIQSKGGIVKEGRLGGMLAVSRALGDGFLGDCVNPTPHIKEVQITSEDAFLIIACDGVWDVMSDQEAVDLIASEIDPLEAARKLRDHAFELNSEDNISVIVVFLSAEEKHNDEEE
ncbi:protein phosphatase 2C [Histomonas meleagridis]|uniref:protein phosphatase 2C n=1 Tax=Histomonas meleagridis TaxID=135588 RepID=UPI00355A8E06|nr:protein phosphatase 2C [Histomonas meleagridis]KAH0798699.1 protein phosphatase 2C [Histomonas meleagridis]